MRYNNREQITKGIDSIHIDAEGTYIFLKRDNDYLPDRIGKMGHWHMIYDANDSTTIFVEF